MCAERSILRCHEQEKEGTEGEEKEKDRDKEKDKGKEETGGKKPAGKDEKTEAAIDFKWESQIEEMEAVEEPRNR